MKTLSEVLRDSGISYRTLVKYVEMGLIPKPQRVWRGRKGSESYYIDDVVNLINRIKLHQKDRGLSLSEVAELLAKDQAEIEIVKPIEEYLIPLKANVVKSYLDVYGDLHNWLQKQIKQHRPGYELYGVDTEIVIKNGEEFLKPKIIKVRPKAVGKKRGT